MKFMIHNIIFPLTLINLLALIPMYWIWVVRLFSCVNILSQIVHCIYHNVHFVWIVGENEIRLSAPNLWQDKQFFEYIHPSSGILYEYEQWIWLFILYFYCCIVFWPFLVLPIFFHNLDMLKVFHNSDITSLDFTEEVWSNCDIFYNNS